MVIFHNNAISKSCQQGIELLSESAVVQEFYLAGGTALALQIGHRISTDLDWFSTKNELLDPQRELLQKTMKELGSFEVISEQDGMLYSRFNGTDTSFMYQHHPLIEPTVEYQGIEMATPTDIGLMKLAAIESRGTRRDFVDIYCIREIISLDNLLKLAPNKFNDRPQFLAVAVRALAYFEDAEQQPMPNMLLPVRWEDVREYCEQASIKLARRLSGLS